ncbi:MAG TPA: flagellar motor protein MotB [Pirellulales bacterium]|jgi:chemotaxis protein MotB
MSEPEQPHSEGAPEWMVSYADMITILMSFFVVMFSMAGSKDKKKEEPVMSALRRQFGRFVGLPSAQLLPAGSPLSAKTNGLKANPAIHDTKTLGLVGDHTHVATIRQGDQLTIGGVIYFKGRATDLTDEQRLELQSCAKELAGKPQKIEVRGHTRNRPFPPDDKIHDNWDLAYERCHKTMDYLVLLGIDPARIRIGVSAQFEPLYAGRDPELLEKNSRVEVFMLNEFTEDLRGISGKEGTE